MKSTQLLDLSVSPQISPSPLSSPAMNPGGGHPATTSDHRHDDDGALTEFLASLMDYAPTIPDELVEHYMAKSGFQCPDVRLIRLVAVATQKFVSEVATDALQHCKARQASMARGDHHKRDKAGKEKRLVLTMEDLGRALREYGVNVKHREYFADGVEAAEGERDDQ